MFVEVAQAFGVSLFVFKVLPNVENVNGLFLMNAVCIVPAILKLIFSSRRDMTRLKKFVSVLLDIVAILCQLSVFGIVKYDGFFYKQKSIDKIQSNWFLLQVILSTLLISLGWWENYTEVRFSTNRFTIFIQNQINDLRKHRAKVYLLVSPVKIVLIFLFGYLLLPAELQKDYSKFNLPVNETLKLVVKKEDIFLHNTGFYWPVVVHIISSAICFFTARIACKVLMQRVAFALPLGMSTGATFFVLAGFSMLRQSERIPIFDLLPDYFFLNGFDRKFNMNFK